MAAASRAAPLPARGPRERRRSARRAGLRAAARAQARAAAAEDPIHSGAWPRRVRRLAGEPGEPPHAPHAEVRYSLFGGSVARFGATVEDKVDYSGEGAFDKFFLQFFARAMAERMGEKDVPESFDDFVELSRKVVARFDAKGCGEMTLGILRDVMPPGTPTVFRFLFPPSKFGCEANAWVTTQFFSFLVGPSSVTEATVNDTVEAKREGRPQTIRSRVHVTKCRWLEQSGCVASCQSMCKHPTQDFFNNEFGLPLTMNPNYETLSCELVFGQSPPSQEEDIASAEGCLSSCNTGVGVGTDAPCHQLPNTAAYLARLEEARAVRDEQESA